MAKETKASTVKKAVKKSVPKTAIKKEAKAKAKKIMTPKNELLKQAISYIPLVGAVLYFVEKEKSADLMKHIKYGTVLFVAYVVLSIILNATLVAMVSLAYLVVIIFLGYKAYTGEAVELDFIDKIEDEVKSKIK